MATAVRKFGEDTNDLLLAKLECPVCFESCTKPIFMCHNGHNVCSVCRPSLISCPVCRVAGRPTSRNLFAEEFSQNELVPCQNAEQGCNRVLKLKEMPAHLQLCDFGFKCMFEDCKWRGSVAALSQHALSIHSKHVFNVGKDGVRLLNDDFDGVCTKCVGNCDQPILRTAMLVFEKNSFWFMSEQTGNSKLKIQIRLISNAYEEPTYFYLVTFKPTDNNEFEITLRNKVQLLTAPALADVVLNNEEEINRYVQGNALPFVLKMAAGFDDALVESFNEPPEFSPQLRQRSLPHWEDLEYIGTRSNERILTKDEFSKYCQYTDKEKKDCKFLGIYLQNRYQNYRLHSF